MNDLAVFSFENQNYRILDRNGDPWFVAKDVCDILGLTNVTEALRSLDDDEKADFSISEVSSNGVRQNRNVIIISESGFYALVFRSKKQYARIFSKKVRSEVLPALRKTGSYALPGQIPWKEPSTARLHELRMILKEGSISIREFRRLALNLDTPDVPDNPIRGALVFKSHDDFEEYAEKHKKANPTVYSFAKTALKTTENPGDFVLVRDLYRLYREYTNTWEAVTRQFFVRRIKELYPGLEYKQKKVNGRPELVFMGCALAEESTG